MKAESVIAASLLLLPAAAGRAAGPEKPGSAGKTPAVKLETIPESTARRVILTAKAAERLGIETSKVEEKPIVRKQMVSGLVIAPFAPQPTAKPAGTGFATFTLSSALAAARRPGAMPATAVSRQPFAVPAAAAEGPDAAPVAAPIQGEAWVLVTLSPGEWEKLAKDKPARVLPLATHEQPASELMALPSGTPPVEDAKRSMLKLYYVVQGKDHGLSPNKRVRVELQQSGSEEKRKVVPYAAVYYDATGATWAYVNTAPLAFERRRIGVERVTGDLAILSDGPSVGTAVVVVGAPLLYGAEIFGK